MSVLDCCTGEVCKRCNAPAEIWSCKKDQPKEFWCSHSCILKFRGQYEYKKISINSGDSRDFILGR